VGIRREYTTYLFGPIGGITHSRYGRRCEREDNLKDAEGRRRTYHRKERVDMWQLGTGSCQVERRTRCSRTYLSKGSALSS